jgi:hypothetical protein
VIGWGHVKDRKSGTSAKPELDFILGEDFEIGFTCEILKALLIVFPDVKYFRHISKLKVFVLFRADNGTLKLGPLLCPEALLALPKRDFPSELQSSKPQVHVTAQSTQPPLECQYFFHHHTLYLTTLIVSASRRTSLPWLVSVFSHFASQCPSG